MSLWMVRGDKFGQQQAAALERGIAYVRFIEVGDLSGAKSREEILALCREAFPDGSEARLRNCSVQRIRDILYCPCQAKK